MLLRMLCCNILYYFAVISVVIATAYFLSRYLVNQRGNALCPCLVHREYAHRIAHIFAHNYHYLMISFAELLSLNSKT